MDTNDLMLLLEALLGPVVADLTAPIPNLAELADGEGVIAPQTRRPGTITTLLSSRPPIGLAVLDAASLRVVRANAALAAMLGRPGREREAGGRPLSELAPNLGDSEVEAAFEQVTRTGQPFAAVVLEERTDGPAFLRCALSPLRHADGTFDTLLLTLLDVTHELEARQLIAQRAHAAARSADDTTRGAVRTAMLDQLARAATLDEALAHITEQIAQPFGDCCAVFLLGEDDQFRLGALHHQDTSQGFRLRAAYAEEPLPRDGDLIGQVLATGNSFLAAQWGPQYTALVAPGLREDVDAAHIASLACVPLQAAGRALGALLLFSTQAGAGGSGRALGSGDLVFLQELADLLAQTVASLNMQTELAVMRAERATLLEATADGVAIYDALGRLRQLNTTARQLLSRPDNGAAPAAVGSTGFKRTFLAPDGTALAADDLPWSRALRGERIGELEPLPLIIEWAGGARRALWTRAWPVLDGAAVPSGAVVSLREAGADGEMTAGVGQGAKLAAPTSAHTSGGDEWARWRETMELLDEAVVLCAPDGAAIFLNIAARGLLNLPGADPNNVEAPDRPLWQHVRQLDGTPLPEEQSPVANALAGHVVRAQPTAVPLPDGTLRPIYWDARRIDGSRGEQMGVALVAWPATETDDEPVMSQPVAAPLDTQDTQPVDLAEAAAAIAAEIAASAAPAAPDSAQQLARTTLLPGRRVARWDPLPSTAPSGVQSDLTEVCAREARAHRGTQGRRLEIRLPRRRVLVAVEESQLERAISALIATASDALPANVPLHVAVWVERSATESPPADQASAIPPGVDVGELNTLLLKDGKLPELLPQTRAVARGATAQASVAVVRVCSPSVRVAAIEADKFAECRALVDQIGGRAWARVDPVLGPTYSFSLPVIGAAEP
jgi:hypothetical protein